jgi:hypothetical protein
LQPRQIFVPFPSRDNIQESNLIKKLALSMHHHRFTHHREGWHHHFPLRFSRDNHQQFRIAWHPEI